MYRKLGNFIAGRKDVQPGAVFPTRQQRLFLVGIPALWILPGGWMGYSAAMAGDAASAAAGMLLAGAGAGFLCGAGMLLSWTAKLRLPADFPAGGYADFVPAPVAAAIPVPLDDEPELELEVN